MKNFFIVSFEQRRNRVWMSQNCSKLKIVTAAFPVTTLRLPELKISTKLFLCGSLLFGNDFIFDLVVSRLRDYLLAHKISLDPVRTPVNDLL